MLLSGSDLIIENVSLNPTRTTYLSVLRDWGAEITTTDVQVDRNEPAGTIHVRGVETLDSKGERISGAMVPALIDELPLLGVIGTQLSSGLEIRDAKELRFKETDRIAAIVRNLRSFGAEVEEYDDGLFVNGPTTLRGSTIEPFGDHRIAMAFSVAALISEGPTDINDSSCVAVSFPEFFELLNEIADSKTN